MDVVAYTIPKVPASKRPSRREQEMTAYNTVSTDEVAQTRPTIGNDLRDAREARGLSVADVEADLRIKAYYIDAIEAGDRAALPDKVYVDGFVRNYATYLQLNADEVQDRFNRETEPAAPTRKGFSRSKSASQVTTASAQNPLAGYTPPRRSESGGGNLGRTLVSLWPLLVLAGLGYAVWFGFIAAREAGIIPDNLSVIGATDAEPPVFTANISDASIADGDGNNTIERPADLSYAKLGTPPYWTLPEDEQAQDGPVASIDIAAAGLFAAHQGMTGISSLVSKATPIDLTPAAASPAIVAEIAAETREALLTPPATPLSDADDTTPITGRSLALVAVEETWIEVKAASGRIRFSGILAPEEAFDIPDDENLVLKVGNAGGLVVELAGDRYGPFGQRGAVMRNIALDRDALSERFKP